MILSLALRRHPQLTPTGMDAGSRRWPVAALRRSPATMLDTLAELCKQRITLDKEEQPGAYKIFNRMRSESLDSRTQMTPPWPITSCTKG
jgi:hypothetical protein